MLLSLSHNHSAVYKVRASGFRLLVILLKSLSFFYCFRWKSVWFPSIGYKPQILWVCFCVKELQELLEAREQECVRLRRELKELKNTVSLRQLLTQGKFHHKLKVRAYGLLCTFRIKCLVGFLHRWKDAICEIWSFHLTSHIWIINLCC